MIRKEKTNSGITLIALIITIIVLLILAGISIATLFGENGILNNAQKSKEQTLIKEYEENLRLAVTEGNANAAIESDKYPTKEDILDNIEGIIRENPKFKNVQVYKIGPGTEEVKLLVITEEGYVYEVYVDKVEYKGKIGKDLEEGDIKSDITLTDEDIEYTYTPSGWTNGEVKVGIRIKKEEYKDQGYEIEYSYNATKWEDYTEELTVRENETKIYTRIKKGMEIGKGYATGNVINIDTEAPTINNNLSKTNVTTKGFTLNVTVTDSLSGLSKIIWKYKKENAESYTEIEEIYKDLHSEQAGEKGQVIKTKEITDLESGTYKAYAEIYDVAGNMETSDEIDITTGIVQTPEEATYTPTGWTNGKVEVTLPILEGFTTRYTIDGNTPNVTSTEYTKPFEVSANCIIKYIYTDGINIGGSGTANITNIDTEVPTIGNATGSTEIGYTGTITVSDIADEGGSGLTGIYISTNSTKPEANAETGWEDNTEATYTKEVTKNGIYNVWVKDEAGNVSEVKTCTVSGIVEVVLTDMTVEIGEKVIITPKIEGNNPYKTIQFTSSKTEIATIDETTGEATGLKVGTTTITCKVTNDDGISKEETCTLNVTYKIGAMVTNYKLTADTETKWRILFTDGEDTPDDKNDDHIYLIADNYVQREKLPKKNETALNAGSYPRSASFTNILSKYNGSSDIVGNTKLPKKYNEWVNLDANKAKTYANVKSVAYMLDTDIWSVYADSTYADYAIGGPTLEMFIKSYNVKKHENGKGTIEYDTSDPDGYTVKWSGDKSYSAIIRGLTQDEYDSLYIIKDTKNAQGMWLASPSGYGNDRVMQVHSNGSVNYWYYNEKYLGFRPVVCLKSSVQLKEVGEEYQIVNVE